MHAHPHGHGHSHRLFAWAMWINLAYSALEAGIGLYSNSLALISDALHNLGDAAGLALAWGAAWMASQPPTERHTFGWRRATQISPLFNAVLLVGFSGALLWEAITRLHSPPDVPGLTVMAVAVFPTNSWPTPLQLMLQLTSLLTRRSFIRSRRMVL